jgi:lipopolysaccharide export LptBFGC system permease protein LptF
MASNMLVLVIALPFYLTRAPTNMLVQSLKCAPVSIGALMGGILGASAPSGALPPQLSVFVPVLILALIGAAAVRSVRT